MKGERIDTRIEIVTPENIAFQYRVAGPFRRLPAYLIDLALRAAVMLALLLAFGFSLGMVGIGLWLVAYFLLDWFYGGLFETYWNGQTPGKRMMRIRVVSDEGQPINGWQAVLRNFLRSADALPAIIVHIGDTPLSLPTYLLGLLTASLNDRYQRLGDLAAGTMVIIEEPQRHYGMVPINEPAAIRLAGELPASFRPSRNLARALAAYVQRRQMFPPLRRHEIAAHVGESLRERFGLANADRDVPLRDGAARVRRAEQEPPANFDYDLLLCALYYRTFIADRNDDAQREAAPKTPAARS